MKSLIRQRLFVSRCVFCICKSKKKIKSQRERKIVDGNCTMENVSSSM